MTSTYLRGDALKPGDTVYAGNGYDERYAEVATITPYPNGDVAFTTTAGTTGSVRFGFEILVRR